jgi:hypothetical protein
MKNRGRVHVYLLGPSSSMSWATFAVASGGGGSVGGEGNGGGAPQLIDAFTFVLLGAEFFDFARDAFGFIAAVGISPVATASPDCGTTCIPACHRFSTLIDETVAATLWGSQGSPGWLVERRKLRRQWERVAAPAS